MFLIAGVLGFIDYIVLEKNLIIAYSSGIVTEFVGIIIIVIFVQIIFDKKSESDSKEEEIKQILRADKIVETLGRVDIQGRIGYQA